MIQSPPIPKTALLLGWLGVFPFAGLALAGLTGTPALAGPAVTGLILYGAVILAFMGGVQWGLAITVGVSAAEWDRRLVASVTPALAAFGFALLPQRAALIGLTAGFVGLLAYDVRAARGGSAPMWYPALRVQLTAAVVLCLSAAAALG